MTLALGREVHSAQRHCLRCVRCGRGAGQAVTRATARAATRRPPPRHPPQGVPSNLGERRCRLLEGMANSTVSGARNVPFRAPRCEYLGPEMRSAHLPGHSNPPPPPFKYKTGNLPFGSLGRSSGGGGLNLDFSSLGFVASSCPSLGRPGACRLPGIRHSGGSVLNIHLRFIMTRRATTNRTGACGDFEIHTLCLMAVYTGTTHPLARPDRCTRNTHFRPACVHRQRVLACCAHGATP